MFIKLHHLCSALNKLIRYLYTSVRSFLNLLSSRLDSPSSLYLSLHEPCKVQSLGCFHGPSPGSFQDTPNRCVSSGESRNGHSTPGEAWRGLGSPPSTCWQHLPSATHDTTALFCHKDTRLAHVELYFHQDLQILICKAAFQLDGPQSPKSVMTRMQASIDPQCTLPDTGLPQCPADPPPSEPGCSPPLQGSCWRLCQVSDTIKKYLVPPLIQIAMCL